MLFLVLYVMLWDMYRALREWMGQQFKPEADTWHV
jgi:hypothetical protein